MTNDAHESRASIQSHLKKLSQKPGHQQRLGPLTPVAGYILILLFAVFLLPLFLYMLLFNRIYFWVRNQKPIARRAYLRFDRHQIDHLSFVDKIWCEYCEWANGTLQWTSDITKEIERRYCPIKNKLPPDGEKPKAWREKFLEYDHTSDELREYYEEQYIDETPK